MNWIYWYHSASRRLKWFLSAILSSCLALYCLGYVKKKVDKSLLLPFFCAFLKRICLASVNDPLVFQSYSPLWFCDPSFLAIPTNWLLLGLFLFYILLEATHSCSQLVIDLWHILTLFFFSWFVSGASAKHSISIIWIRMGWASIIKNVLKPDENVITFPSPSDNLIFS